jgi:hypothetical protein
MRQLRCSASQSRQKKKEERHRRPDQTDEENKKWVYFDIFRRTAIAKKNFANRNQAVI